MPGLADHSSTSIVRLLNIGENGTGKTGQLASLAEAGYRLHILDFDNGLDILANLLRDKPEAMARTQYETLRDKVAFVNGVPTLKAPITAFQNAGKVLAKWEADKFVAEDVLVIDTLSTMSEAAFNYALQLAGRLNQRPQIQDYGTMADRVRLFIEMITSDEMKCSVIVNTHIRYFAGDEDTATAPRGLPNAKGQEIPRTVASFFNTVVLSHTVGRGPAARRQISTRPEGVIEVKTSNPLSVKPKYSVETGLAELFSDILGRTPTPVKQGN